jgi:hypothetical protein
LPQRSRKRGRRAKPGSRSAPPSRGPRAAGRPKTAPAGSPEQAAAKQEAPGRKAPRQSAAKQEGAGRRKAPKQERPQWFVPQGEELTRSQRRDAEARARLKPLSPGERPGAILASTLIAGLIGFGQLIAFFAGLKIHGKTPAAGGTIAFCFIMIVCAAGMWQLWYGAVLGFMALLAIVATLFSLYLIEASNLLGLVVALVVIVGSGYLFFKLVRVLSRIQMPRPPGG